MREPGQRASAVAMCMIEGLVKNASAAVLGVVREVRMLFRSTLVIKLVHFFQSKIL